MHNVPPKPCAESPEMICLNCKNYDTVWLNCVLLGFDGIRENPNMRCNIEIEKEGEKRWAFTHKNTKDLKADQALIDSLLGEEHEHKHN